MTKKLTSNISDGNTKDFVSTAVFNEAIREVIAEGKEETSRQIHLEKESFFSVFGVFAIFFSFISIEFQLLKSLYSWQKMVGFSLILWALLLGFFITIHLLMKFRSDVQIPKLYYIFLGLFVALSGLGCVIAFYGNEEFCRERQSYQAAYKIFEEEQGKLYRSYDQKIKKNEISIGSFNSKLQDIEDRLSKATVDTSGPVFTPPGSQD